MREGVVRCRSCGVEAGEDLTGWRDVTVMVMETSDGRIVRRVPDHYCPTCAVEVDNLIDEGDENGR